jgi:hypothetical protein
VKIDVGVEIPSRIAYWVPGKAHDYNGDLTDAEIKKLDWQPYKPELMVNLGPGVGNRDIWFVAEWENPKEYKQIGETITIDSVIPSLVITYPTNRITSQPWLQLQGYCSGEMMNLRYDISNSTGSKLRTSWLIVPAATLIFTAPVVLPSATALLNLNTRNSLFASSWYSKVRNAGITQRNAF